MVIAMSHAPLRTILLAEDSLVDAEMTMDALRSAYLANPVVHVEDGVDCLDWLYARGAFADRGGDDPAVVLLDIKMPRMNGLEVLTQMRADDRFRRTPVVILSSSREESDLVHSWDLGVNAYVIKPVDVEQFFQAVRTLGQFWGVLNQPPEGE
jgi:two-component system response regulator